MIRCSKTMQKAANTPAYPVSHQLSQQGFYFKVYPSVEDLPVDWEKAEFEKNLFLQRAYLSVVENSPPYGMDFNYLIFYKNEDPVGRAIFQITKFDASRSVQGLHHDPSRHSIWWRIGQYFKKIVAKWAKFNLLVCGSSLLTGEHGFIFDEVVVSREMAIKMLEEAGVLVSEYLSANGLKIHGYFLKDLNIDKAKEGVILDKLKFHEFVFHPNMVLPIRNGWDNFEDYMSAITSKYRVRAKRAFKKAKGIEKIELNAERLGIANGSIYQLYKNVANQASFNMVSLGENYFLELKEHLGDAFRIFGYYQDGELVGFYTTIENEEELEAHFLGIDGATNHRTQLYLNMLFHMIQQGIEMGKKKVVFARTAMEIKSSVGAVPEQLYGYIRANNSIINWVLTPILEFLRPNDDWKPRQPFKD